MSTEDVINQLQHALKELEDADAAVESARKSTDKARGIVAQTLRGGSSQQLAALIGQINNGCEQLNGGLDAAKQKVKETIEKVRALGN